MAKNKTQSVQKAVHDAKLKAGDERRSVLKHATESMVASIVSAVTGRSQRQAAAEAFHAEQHKQPQPRHRRGNASMGSAW